MSYHKGIAGVIAVVIIAVAALGGGAYFYQNNRQDSSPVTASTTMSIVPTKLAPRAPSDSKFAVSGWSTFVNTKLGYSFQYPKGELDITGDIAVGEDPFPPETSSSVRLSSNQKTTFSVEVPDPVLNNYTGIDRVMKLSAKGLAEDIWKQNKESRSPSEQGEVGALTQTQIDGTVAYQFTLTGSYEVDDEGYTLDRSQQYIFVGHNGVNYTISFPSEDARARAILNSFKFAK